MQTRKLEENHFSCNAELCRVQILLGVTVLGNKGNVRKISVSRNMSLFIHACLSFLHAINNENVKSRPSDNCSRLFAVKSLDFYKVNARITFILLLD